MASISHRDKDGGVIYRTIETERIVVDLFRGSQSGMDCGGTRCFAFLLSLSGRSVGETFIKRIKYTQVESTKYWLLKNLIVKACFAT